jgi:two-component system aerobic respiration control sensor histidine kinase ArcB
LLDLAKFSRGSFKLQKENVDIVNLVSNIIKQYQTLAEQQLKHLVFETEETLPEIVADSARMEQVLVNLLSNAIKYSPENTTITLKVRKTPADLIIEVQDQGIGVTPEEQQQIFSPYHRVVQDTQKYPGIGLGLAISKQIIEAHGGKIGVESQLNKGSTFIVQMPLTKTIPV